MGKIYTADKEAGNIIEECKSIKDALQKIKEYEEEDKNNGCYKPNFYDVVNEENCSMKINNK